MQNEWVQHRRGQPRRPAGSTVLWAELLFDRGRGALRPLGWKRLLQQEDPEEHIAEEAQVGYRQECKTTLFCVFTVFRFKSDRWTRAVVDLLVFTESRMFSAALTVRRYVGQLYLPASSSSCLTLFSHTHSALYTVPASMKTISVKCRNGI